jgi:hypothetical protein
MKTQITNLGYSTKGNPMFTVRFTEERSKIDKAFFQSDGGSSTLNPEVGAFLNFFGVASSNNNFTTVVTKAVPNMEMMEKQLTVLATDKVAMADMFSKLKAMSPIQGENTWVLPTGDQADKSFGIELGTIEIEGNTVGLVPVVTRTTQVPGSERKLQPVQNPTTGKALVFKGLEVYEDAQVGVGANPTYTFNEEFVWVAPKTTVVESTMVEAGG